MHSPEDEALAILFPKSKVFDILYLRINKKQHTYNIVDKDINTFIHEDWCLSLYIRLSVFFLYEETECKRI